MSGMLGMTCATRAILRLRFGVPALRRGVAQRSRRIGVLLGMTVFAVALLAACTSTHAADKIRIVLAGDSTVTEKEGWGIGFRELLTRDVELHNLAKGGRSSKSFYDEGIWAEC